MQHAASIWGIGLWGLAVALALPSQAADKAADDSVILEMQQAFRKGDKARLSALLPSVQGHTLEPWAAYWALRARLEDASAQELRQFFARYEGSYQEDRLRNDWLLLLGKQRDWSTFKGELPRYRMGDDKELRCYAAVQDGSSLKTLSAERVQEIHRLWLGLRDADEGCTYAASELYKARKLSALAVWQKARLAMEAGRLRLAQNVVEIVAPDAVDQLALIHSKPEQYLDKRWLALSVKRKEMVVLALMRTAQTTSPEAAAERLQSKWRLMLNEEERDWVWGAIGKQAAQKLDSNALRWFGEVKKDAHLSDEALAWKARAALRQGQWALVRSAVAAMSDEWRADSTWQYWDAKAQWTLAQHEPDRETARQRLQALASPRGFYEQLALEDLGQRVTVPAKPAPLSADEKAQARSNPGLARALYAIDMGLRTEGVREWNYATNLHTPGGMTERELLAAADWACERQVWDRCINTSERTRQQLDWSQRYPMPHRELVSARSKAIDLDPAYVYGLIRQESRFIMDARSGVGASGLMQIMPATARWTAKKIGLKDFTPSQINDRSINVTIGTAYLKLALDDFEGSMPMAAAAYNAGPARPRAWRNGPVMEGAIWAENVPFSETRDYVKKVLANTTNYAALMTGQPQSLRARLGTIGPRTTLTPEPTPDLP